MSDSTLVEQPVHLGAGGHLLGIVTEPRGVAAATNDLPVFIFFNAGLLHRVGPHRLYVQTARALARNGFPALRIDFTGKGDSPQRPEVTHRESIVMDFEEIVRGVRSRFGPRPLVLGGLCAGADAAVRLTPLDESVKGLLLLDPICFPDAGFATRTQIMKYSQPGRYVSWLKRRLEGSPKAAVAQELDPLSIRDMPSLQEMRAAFTAIGSRGGRVLSIFSEYALRYYNQLGQLGRVLEVNDYSTFATELFWPAVEHTYPIDLHRRQLLDVAANWANGFRQPEKAA